MYMYLLVCVVGVVGQAFSVWVCVCGGGCGGAGG